MFTGLIEDLGHIVEIADLLGGRRFCVKTKLNPDELKIGDSISVNGACQTITDIKANAFCFESMNETLKKTNFSLLKKNDVVNLERAMKVNSRLNGHIVSGHIDCVLPVSSVKDDGIAKIFKIKGDTKYIIETGSISINGISLTVCNLYDDSFEVSILPHTLVNTNLKTLKQGDLVNIEYDIIGKYFYKFLNKKESKITYEFLKENGF